MKRFDAHLHFDLTCSDPAAGLAGQLTAAGIDGCNLIVNSDPEKAMLQQMLRNHSLPSAVRCISATYYRDPTSFEALRDALNRMHIPLFIKIHARHEDITAGDIPQLLSDAVLRRAATVIVDDFPYGHRIENHIGTQLGIAIACAYPEKNVILAHAGGYRMVECMMLTRDLRNVFYDFSLTCTYFSGASVAQDSALFLRYAWDRILFGSDYPGYGIETALECFMELVKSAGLSDAQTEAVLHNNAKEIFLLEE